MMARRSPVMKKSGQPWYEQSASTRAFRTSTASTGSVSPKKESAAGLRSSAAEQRRLRARRLGKALSFLCHLFLLWVAFYHETSRNFCYGISGVILGLQILSHSIFVGEAEGGGGGLLQQLIQYHQYFRYWSRLILPSTLFHWLLMERGWKTEHSPVWWCIWGCEFGYQCCCAMLVLSKWGLFKRPRLVWVETLSYFLYRELWTWKAVLTIVTILPSLQSSGDTAGDVLTVIQSLGEIFVSSGAALSWWRQYHALAPFWAGSGTALYSGAKVLKYFV